MAKVNSKGRTFVSGQPLSEDFRKLVCDEMVASGAPVGVYTFAGIYSIASKVGDKFKISKTSVLKYWKKHCLDGDVKPLKKGREKRIHGKLSDDQLAFIEYLLEREPSLTAVHVHTKLLGYSNFPDGLHICTVWRAIKMFF